jgi:sugar O-acyltransferase (sialic acid O-acetyltransferase NeuD family)
MAGAGSFAVEITEVCAAAGIEVAAWIEGLDRSRADPNHEPPIVWVDEQARFEPELSLVIGIGSVARRDLVERLEAEGRRLLTVCHPSAIVSPSATIDDGCVILPGVIVAAQAHIGRGTIINRGATVGHHAVVGAHSFIGPGANVAGFVTVGEQVYVAVGATVRDRVTIGDRAVVGAGGAAVRDVAAGTTVVGVPARPIQREPG